MKTYKKLIIIAILIMCVCIYVIPSHTYASELSWFTISEKAENFEKEGEKQNKVIDASDVTQGLANILTTIGVITVLGALLIIGIKYMMASPDEAAKLKKQLIGVVLAGAVIIGAFGIWKITKNIFNSITEGSGSSQTESAKPTEAHGGVLGPTETEEPEVTLEPTMGSATGGGLHANEEETSKTPPPITPSKTAGSTQPVNSGGTTGTTEESQPASPSENIQSNLQSNSGGSTQAEFNGRVPSYLTCSHNFVSISQNSTHLSTSIGNIKIDSDKDGPYVWVNGGKKRPQKYKSDNSKRCYYIKICNICFWTPDIGQIMPYYGQYYHRIPDVNDVIFQYHVYKSRVIVREGTCKQREIYRDKCIVCNGTTVEKEGAYGNHKFIKDLKYKTDEACLDVTCTTVGIYYTKCSVNECGEYPKTLDEAVEYLKKIYSGIEPYKNWNDDQWRDHIQSDQSEITISTGKPLTHNKIGNTKYFVLPTKTNSEGKPYVTVNGNIKYASLCSDATCTSGARYFAICSKCGASPKNMAQAKEWWKNDLQGDTNEENEDNINEKMIKAYGKKIPHKLVANKTVIINKEIKSTTVIKQPTCQEKGVYFKICSKCGYSPETKRKAAIYFRDVLHPEYANMSIEELKKMVIDPANGMAFTDKRVLKHAEIHNTLNFTTDTNKIKWSEKLKKPCLIINNTEKPVGLYSNATCTTKARYFAICKICGASPSKIADAKKWFGIDDEAEIVEKLTFEYGEYKAHKFDKKESVKINRRRSEISK